jgi:hypothetical protein
MPNKPALIPAKTPISRLAKKISIIFGFGSE